MELQIEHLFVQCVWWKLNKNVVLPSKHAETKGL